MSMNIKDPKVHAMAKELAKLTGRSMTEAVKLAVEQALTEAKAQQKQAQSPPLGQRLNAIALRCAALPNLDLRSREEILG
ncbi:type II toxin-antitoxin system VapB family antitoxin [Spirulina sp. CS-785/01]|uniref:type II toxin-antitoxin system VapB family antitoxin n=1 Tax=Spirulina sp. CS-785/01 TaxID=3021716 RepID=UPI00232C2B83|nr:type II toxin-antitoxin system VapB family antitoxin [Spirulina sp. CS-785/01]MDB9312980.1 type II toxin-antitoxin system VapB family antitoxin [Spirulina sp. CS-785/01]